MVDLTLLSEQTRVYFFLLPYRQKEKTEYHVQYFTIELMINVEGLALMYTLFMCYSFLTLIVKFLTSATACFNRLFL